MTSQAKDIISRAQVLMGSEKLDRGAFYTAIITAIKTAIQQAGGVDLDDCSDICKWAEKMYDAYVVPINLIPDDSVFDFLEPVADRAMKAAICMAIRNVCQVFHNHSDDEDDRKRRRVPRPSLI